MCLNNVESLEGDLERECSQIKPHICNSVDRIIDQRLKYESNTEGGRPRPLVDKIFVLIVIIIFVLIDYTNFFF
jgi:hypothetical protein